MRGQVLGYDPLKAEGFISGEDGNRYAFSGAEWKAATSALRNGAAVDFQTDGAHATGIYVMTPAVQATAFGAGPKSPIAAGLLALFFGPLGIHKFYLGYNREGGILLGGTILSWLLVIVVIGILGIMAIGVVCLVEAIIYLTKSQDEFTRLYVDAYKPWF